MTDVAAATRALLMNLAGPTLDRPGVEAIIRDTYTDPAAARHLAHATAEAIAEKLDTTPLALRLTSPASQHAYLLIAAHDMHDPDAGELLDGLSTDHLAGVCIALLGMWRGACAASARVALDGTPVPEEALEALLRPQEGENTPRGVGDAPRAADGRTAP